MRWPRRKESFSFSISVRFIPGLRLRTKHGVLSRSMKCLKSFNVDAGMGFDTLDAALNVIDLPDTIYR